MQIKNSQIAILTVEILKQSSMNVNEAETLASSIITAQEAVKNGQTVSFVFTKKNGETRQAVATGEFNKKYRKDGAVYYSYFDSAKDEYRAFCPENFVKVQGAIISLEKMAA